MSLSAFQRALSDLSASPRLCHALQAQPDRLFRSYQLTSRERHRLVDIARQPGLTVHCGLYRVNRITPVYTLLPLTCTALGNDLRLAAERYWAAQEDLDLQFRREISRFATFLKDQLQRNEIVNPFLEEVLDFEMAANALRYLPRREIRRMLSDLQSFEGPARLGLHPLTRVVRFAHEPSRLIAFLKARQPIQDLAEGEFYLLLQAIREELIVKSIHPLLGRLLQTLESDEANPLEIEGSTTLIRARLAVRAPASFHRAVEELALM